LNDWINEMDEKELMVKYKIGLGVLNEFKKEINWIVYAFKRIRSNDMTDELNNNLMRISYGVKNELVEYVKMKGVGKKKARYMYESEKRNPKLVGD